MPSSAAGQQATFSDCGLFFQLLSGSLLIPDFLFGNFEDDKSFLQEIGV